MTTIKERPILFSAPMVRAILAGTKTQTRRVVKWQGPKGFPHDFERAFTDNPAGFKRLMVPYHHPDDDYSDGVAHRHYPPHGDPGDRLWVRETWRQAYRRTDYSSGVVYRADAPRALGMDEYSYRHKWKPSIHMPRWASRITLKITAVRVERLQDISEADARAEGVERTVIGEGWRRYADPTEEVVGIPPCDSAFNSFQSLWEHINGPGSWALNPWVWCISFRRIK